MVEQEARIKRLREALTRNNVDLALILNPINVYYFTGTNQKSALTVDEDEAILYVFRDKERAKRETYVPCQPVNSLREIVGNISKKKVRVIGLEEDVLPVKMYKRIMSTIHCNPRDISPTILHIRSVKDREEIGKIKLAVEQVTSVLERVPGILREGIREIEAAAKLEYLLRKEGHDGYLDMRSWGDRMPNLVVLSSGSMVPGRISSVTVGPGFNRFSCVGSGRKKLRRGDVVWIDVSGRFEGYCCDVTRCYVMGEVNEDFEAGYEAIKEVYKRVISRIREGMDAKEIYREAVSFMEEAGYGENFMGLKEGRVPFIGHGVGLEIDEYPLLSGKSLSLKENMVIALEPKLVFPGYSGVGLESTVAVKRDCCEVLERINIELGVI